MQMREKAYVTHYTFKQYEICYIFVMKLEMYKLCFKKIICVSKNIAGEQNYCWHVSDFFPITTTKVLVI